MILDFGVALIVTGALGYSSSARSTVSDEKSVRARIEVAALLKVPAEQGKSVPRRTEDLRPYENAYPTGYEAIRSGRVVVAWSGATGEQEAVLAHEKAVPTADGLVLFRDGTIKPLTPDEFNAAPKGK